MRRGACAMVGDPLPAVFPPFLPISRARSDDALCELNNWTPKFPTPLLTLGHWWLRTTCLGRAMPPSLWLLHHLLRWPEGQLSGSQKLNRPQEVITGLCLSFPL